MLAADGGRPHATNRAAAAESWTARADDLSPVAAGAAVAGDGRGITAAAEADQSAVIVG